MQFDGLKPGTSCEFRIHTQLICRITAEKPIVNFQPMLQNILAADLQTFKLVKRGEQFSQDLSEYFVQTNQAREVLLLVYNNCPFIGDVAPYEISPFNRRYNSMVTSTARMECKLRFDKEEDMLVDGEKIEITWRWLQ